MLFRSGKTTAAKFDGSGKRHVLRTIGKVNAVATTIKGFSYKAETLLFLGMDANETLDAATGLSAYQATLKFAVTWNHTWNEFWDGKTHRKIIPEVYFADVEFSDINPDNWTA